MRQRRWNSQRTHWRGRRGTRRMPHNEPVSADTEQSRIGFCGCETRLSLVLRLTLVVGALFSTMYVNDQGSKELKSTPRSRISASSIEVITSARIELKGLNESCRILLRPSHQCLASFWPDPFVHTCWNPLYCNAIA